MIGIDRLVIHEGLRSALTRSVPLVFDQFRATKVSYEERSSSSELEKLSSFFFVYNGPFTFNSREFTVTGYQSPRRCQLGGLELILF